jgi:acyl-CoA synthetase (AMP-forming)/AMP-acid ligase II
VPQPRSVTALLDRAVARWPSLPAVVTDDATVTYEQLRERVEHLAAGFVRAGVAPGDRVAASLPNGVDLVVAFYATARVGAIWVGITRELAPPEKLRMLADVTPRMFLAEPEAVSAIANGAAELGIETVAVDAGDSGGAGGAFGRWAELCASPPMEHDPVDAHAPAAIAFTSGTSGVPKGVVHSQHNLVLPGEVMAASRGYDTSLRRGDYLSLNILNLIVLSTLTAAQVGGASVLRDSRDADTMPAWIRRHAVTLLNAVPTTLYALGRADTVDPAEVATLQDLWTGGAACPQEVRDRVLERFGLPVHMTYGLTEAPSVVALDPVGDPSPEGLSGRVLPHLAVDLVLVGEGDGDAEDGRGQMVVRAATDGPWAGCYTPFLGYWNRPDVEVPVVDGGLRTGDIGCFDDGRLRVVDRLGSVIIRGGANVYPAEVERVLRTLPGVADAVVVGVPDPRLGETVQAVVEQEAGATVHDGALIAGCRAELAAYKVPVRIVVVDALERNALGKPDQRAAKASLAEGS